MQNDQRLTNFGTSEMRSRGRMRMLVDDKEWVENVMEDIAGGEKLAEIARKHNIRYNIFYNILRNKHSEKIEAARAAHAEEQVHKNLALADEVEAGRADPAVLKAVSGVRHWYAERVNNQTYGQKTSSNVTVQGSVDLHMQAIKEFTGNHNEDVVDAEFEEVKDTKDHPLL